jgi:hypothetical protein
MNGHVHESVGLSDEIERQRAKLRWEILEKRENQPRVAKLLIGSHQRSFGSPSWYGALTVWVFAGAAWYAKKEGGECLSFESPGVTSAYAGAAMVDLALDLKRTA